MNKVAIVVPHHKAEFSKNERISLEQLNCVLGDYPIFVVAPIHLRGKLSLYNWKNVFVPDESFGSTDRYSKTFMSPWLYEMFDDYEYMMIYQTDAFVFKDRLMEFCSLGYDYIGAPWNSYDPITRKLGIRVGNGGFCIKKIKSVLNVLAHKEEILNGQSMREQMEQIEDVFFAYCGTKRELSFKVPNVDIASSFSIEHSVNGSLDRLKEETPFGCHDWFRLNYEIWKPYVEGFGYITDSVDSQGNEADYRLYCLMSYIEELLDDSTLISFFKDATKTIPQKVAIWGYGDYGKIFEKVLKLAGKNVVIFDKNIHYPSIDDIKEQFVVISTRKYRDEISAELSNGGFEEYIDYIAFDTLIESMLNRLFPEG